MTDSTLSLLTLEESIRLAMKVDCWRFLCGRAVSISSHSNYTGTLERLTFEIEKIEEDSSIPAKAKPPQYTLTVLYSPTIANMQISVKGREIILAGCTYNPLEKGGISLGTFKDGPTLIPLFEHLETQRKANKVEGNGEFWIGKLTNGRVEDGLHYARKFL
ncbi:MAG: hypothetical protein V2A62_01505 [Candidatus Woesearchaeota archaeon]